MFVSRVKPNTFPREFPTRDVLEVITSRPLREDSSVFYPKRVVESIRNRKLDAGSFWILSDKCTKVLCETNEKIKKSYEDAQKFFTKKTKPEEAIAWADKQVSEIGDTVEVPQIGKSLQTII